MSVPARIGLITLACRDIGGYEREFGPVPSGFGGFTLCLNFASMDEVRAAHDALAAIDGVELLDEPAEALWGGRQLARPGRQRLGRRLGRGIPLRRARRPHIPVERFLTAARDGRLNTRGYTPRFDIWLTKP